MEEDKNVLENLTEEAIRVVKRLTIELLEQDRFCGICLVIGILLIK
jgi:hypothetical protein